MNTVKKENELLDVDDAARYLGLKASVPDRVATSS